MAMNEETLEVKICGLKDVTTLQAVHPLPIDYIGLVFAESKRKVSLEYAGEMIRELRSWGEKRPLAVGIFVNPEQSELEQIMRDAPLDVMQFSGCESAELCAWVKENYNIQVWKSVSVPPKHTEEEAESAADASVRISDGRKEAGRTPASLLTGMLHEYIDVVLLDTYDPSASGGTGKTFAWETIPACVEQLHGLGKKCFVAGGLNPDNVDRLLDTYHPDGVDVSSGVETDGVKDIAKIKAFVERVKGNGSASSAG